MSTTIEIDDKLMKDVLEATGLQTEQEAVELGLRTLLKRKQARRELLDLYGKIQWEGDLDAMRTDS
jgi:Arc/MetJ family transcription regulator